MYHCQGGDPNSKVGYGPEGTLKGADGSKVRTWGTGGPGYNIKAEFNERKHEFGVLSMARSANPDSAGSQFFVCLGPLKSLDGKYTTFGKMIKVKPDARARVLQVACERSLARARLLLLLK